MATKRKTSGKKWMQKATARMKKKGTVGKTREACKRMGYKSGCSSECLNKLQKRGGKWAKRAAFAKAACKSRKKK